MNILIPLLQAIASITLFVGMLHLGVARLGVRSRIHGSFALICIIASATLALISIQMSTAELDAHIHQLSWMRSLALLFFMIYPGFIGVLTDRIQIWHFITAPGWLLLLALNMTLPYGISFSSVSAVVPTVLPWGETLFVPIGDASPWLGVQSALSVFTCAQALLIAWSSARQSSLRQPPGLTLTTALFLTANASDALVKLGLSDLIYLAEYAFLGLLLYMSLVLLGEVAHGARALNEVRRLNAEIALTQERERRRLAEGLHDGPIQKLALATMQLEVAIRQSPPIGLITQAHDLIQQAGNELRECVFHLNPPQPDDLSLAGSLDWMARDVDKYAPPRCHFTADAMTLERLNEAFGDQAQILIYHAVNELVLNAVKHAEAAYIEIDCCFSGQGRTSKLSIEVRDDGKGFDAQRNRVTLEEAHHFGLNHVRQRLYSLGGELELHTNESGSTAKMVIPIANFGRNANGSESRSG